MYLHAGAGQAPSVYMELLLCRDVYHCLPSELKRERARDILLHLACMEIEGQKRRVDAAVRSAKRR
jgi:hypothetical protein